jgi:hypothetical protein
MEPSTIIEALWTIMHTLNAANQLSPCSRELTCFVAGRSKEKFCGGEKKLRGQLVFILRAARLYLAGVYIYLAGCHDFSAS